MASKDQFWSEISRQTFENEAEVETRLILPLLGALNYAAEDIRPKYPVIFQEGRRGRKPETDFAVFGEKPHCRATSFSIWKRQSFRHTLADGIFLTALKHCLRYRRRDLHMVETAFRQCAEGLLRQRPSAAAPPSSVMNSRRLS
jgi:hypothetical protein